MNAQDIQALRQHIRARCIEEGDCWIWQRAFDHTAPAMRPPDGRRIVVNVRRFMLAQQRDMTGLLASNRCGDRRCVAPDHLIAVTRRRLQQLTAERTGYHRHPVRRAKMAAAATARAGIGAEKVAAILASDEPGRVIAQRLGVSLSTVQAWRNGRRFRAGDPFAGLQSAGAKEGA